MISITRLNGKEMLVNAELIEFIESTPDTIITTSSGKKVIVRDSVEEVVRKVVEYRRICVHEKRYKPLTEQEIQLYNKNVE